MPHQPSDKRWLCITPWGFEFRPYIGQPVPGWFGRKIAWWLLGVQWIKTPMPPLEMFTASKDKDNG